MTGSEDAAIVQAVIGLGHTLGIAVIAEGVETTAQRELLRAWSCDQIQGYHYGRPLPTAETRHRGAGSEPVQKRTRLAGPASGCQADASERYGLTARSFRSHY